MTNKEKFKEVFGREANINECPIYCDAPDEGKCPYYKNECYSGEWWDAEYKEPTTKNDLGVDCISRQEVLRLLANSVGKTNTYLQTEVLKMASATLQEPRWIPVSERLPEATINVLVTSVGGYVYISRLVHGEWEYGGEVIAWMPLPEPYKEKK